MRILKNFGFDYGHRVWNQSLNAELSLTTECKCRYLHGHRGSLDIIVEGPVTNGMITDFKHFNVFKKWLDDYIDHKFIIDENDPNYDIITGLNNSSCQGYSEHFKSFFIVDFVPTSENLCKFFFEKASYILNDGIAPARVVGVRFKETPSSECVYFGGSNEESLHQ